MWLIVTITRHKTYSLGQRELRGQGLLCPLTKESPAFRRRECQDGREVKHYVQGQNLHDFTRDIADYQILVTYNGKAFDVPFIERHFGIRLTHAHIDLMYVLRSLGYAGGLKGCERKSGLERGDLAAVDGFFAVLLWQEYQRNQADSVLETLLDYNMQDVLNLETLLLLACNLKLKATPFQTSHQMTVPATSRNPFTPDQKVIARLSRQHAYSSRSRY